MLVAGWLAAVPIPPLLIWAPDWGWVVAANVLLGVNQGLTWSTTVIMKIDLAGPRRRGLAMGLNEAAGYGAVAVTALVTGYLAAAYGLRPAPFLLGAACIALGLGLSAAAVRETRGHARYEAAGHVAAAGHLAGHLTTGQVARLTSFSEPALSAASQAGMVNNLNDGAGLGRVPGPVRPARADRQPDRHPGRAVPGGVGHRTAGHRRPVGPDRPQMADRRRDGSAGRRARHGRRSAPPSARGRSAAVLLGVGTAMVYPTLLAAVGDVAHPAWRARSVGVYRLWRDGGFAVGAAARRRDRRRVRDPGRDLGRRRAHRRLRPGRSLPHVRNPARPQRRITWG